MAADVTIGPGRWIRFARELPDARVRLLCFAHAGGGASTYRAWPARLAGHGIAVWPVQTPGREDRFGEPPVSDLAALTSALVDALADRLEGHAYALFGHSAGAALAYAFALEAQTKGWPPPGQLFVSAHRPPSHPDPDSPVHGWERARFVDKLLRYGGMPAEVVGNDELLDLALPVVRADFALFETARWPSEALLDCPVTAVGGVSDRTVPASVLPAWNAVTRGPFDVQLLPGGHFRPPTAERKLLEVLVDGLAEDRTA
jgi:medium-chain acyl-[acyl-carrier-protein] hydrolase